MKKTLSALPALALCLALLAACSGGKEPSGSSAPSPSASSPSASQPAAPSAEPSPVPSIELSPAPSDGPSQEPSQTPSQEPSSEPSQGPGGDPTSAPSQGPADPTFELSSHDFTLFSAGSSWKLTYTAVPDQGVRPTFTSGDESVATVDEHGTVTAVAPGQTVITAVCGDLTDTCIVRCRWEEAPQSVDLAAFAQHILDSYAFSSLQLLEPGTEMGDAVLGNYYPGLTDLDLPQCLVYLCMMTMNSGEFAVLEAADAAAAAQAAAILQARVDTMANGGAWYPEATRIWSECAAVVTNGNDVMMVVSEQQANIVKEFNGLF